MKPLALDLFSGTGSATDEFARRGWRRVRVEKGNQFDAEVHGDILKLTAADLLVYGRPTFVWASPPCTSFSQSSNRHHWRAATTCRTCGGAMYRRPKERWWHEYRPDCSRVKAGELELTPKSPKGELGLALLEHTLDLIRELEPRWWIIENPVALMRKMPVLTGVERRTITHCQYGDPRRMKPTDLFGVFPERFEARACKNRAPCHEAAPRGSRTGTQGLSAVEAGMLPPQLPIELCDAMEAEL